MLSLRISRNQSSRCSSVSRTSLLGALSGALLGAAFATPSPVCLSMARFGAG
jgi:hypothetical protein